MIGNVGKNPDIRTIDQGGQQVKVASFTIATSEKYTDRNGQSHENTEWHSCVCWRKQAELIEKYVSKGDKLFIEGKLRTRKYEKNGEDRYVTEVVVDTMQFLGKKQEKNEQPQMQESAPADDDMPF